MSAAEEINEAILEELRAIRRALERQGREVLSARAAAKLLGKAPSYVRALVDSGQLPGRAGKRYEIARADLDELVRRGLPSLPGKRGRPRKDIRRTEDRLLAIPLPAKHR